MSSRSIFPRADPPPEKTLMWHERLQVECIPTCAPNKSENSSVRWCYLASPPPRANQIPKTTFFHLHTAGKQMLDGVISRYLPQKTHSKDDIL